MSPFGLVAYVLIGMCVQQSRSGGLVRMMREGGRCFAELAFRIGISVCPTEPVWEGLKKGTRWLKMMNVY